jgi:hypothetical protein
LHGGVLEPVFLQHYEAAYERMSAGDGSLFDALQEAGSDDYLVRLHVGRVKKGETGTELKMTDK